MAAAARRNTAPFTGPLIPFARRRLRRRFGGGKDGVGKIWRAGGLLRRFELAYRDRAACSVWSYSSFDSRLKVAHDRDKIRDDITRQVVEAFTRWQSLGDQINDASRALAAAEEGLRLTRERKEFAVGIVLENIQAEQDLTRGRLDYFKTVAEFNKAQYALNRAIGKL